MVLPWWWQGDERRTQLSRTRDGFVIMEEEGGTTDAGAVGVSGGYSDELEWCTNGGSGSVAIGEDKCDVLAVVEAMPSTTAQGVNVVNAMTGAENGAA